MLKIIFAAVISCGFFLTGVIFLKQEKSEPKIVYDFEDYCDETTYLSAGSTFFEPEEKVELAPGIKFLTIEDGHTLHSILRPHGVSEQEIHNLGQAINPYLLARDLSAGDLYYFSLNKDGEENTLNSFLIKKLDQNRLDTLYEAIKTDGNFIVKVTQPEIIEKQETIRLLVKGTLYETFNSLPFGTELMQRLMEVFAWQMNMPKEVDNNDSIEILVTKKYALGEFISYGKIHSVYYHQKMKSLFAINFSSSDEKIRGFFDENGKSLEKEFAYSPVYETTATSSQQWRMHPIRKVRIRHNGIDYRGPIGTNFFSIADGEVIEKRFDKNVGNMIRVRHKYGVHSEYFHADTLENLAVGSKVKRGQKLGTIGRTGRLCTGPHLHMGLYKLKGEKRQYIELSSLKNILKSAPDINAKYLTEFNQFQKEIAATFKGQLLADDVIKEGEPVVSR